MSYRRGPNYSNSFNELGRGYQRPMQMNPWNNSSEPRNSNSGNYQENATLLLANNLISNLIRNSNNILPSLLDVNPMPMDQDYGSPRMRQGVPGKMLNRSNMSRQGNRDYSRNRVAKMSGTNNIGNNKRSKQFKKTPGNLNNRNNKSQPGKRSNNASEDQKGNEAANEEKQVDNVEKTTDSSDEQNATKTDGGNAESPKKNVNEFEGVEKRYFKCHVCKKSMWDGTSFKKHLKGRAHLMMMESLSDSYAIKGQLIRHEIRMAENTRQIETERKRRFGKGQNVNKQSMPVFCAMCDTEFTNTTLTLHRHSSGHLRLKRFLHPKCISCDQEFPTRIDWDEHLLSTSHIKKISELGIIKLSSEDDELKEYVEQGEDAGIDMQKYTMVKVQDANVIKQTIAETSEEGGEKTSKPDNFTDFAEGTDLSGCTLSDLPKYDPKTPVGMSFIKEIPCYSCTICHHFMATSEAAAVHMKSLKHYESFMKIMKKQVASAQQKKSKQEGPEENNANELEETSEDKQMEATDNVDENINASEMSNDNIESAADVKVEQQEQEVKQEIMDNIEPQLPESAAEGIEEKKNEDIDSNEKLLQTNNTTNNKEVPKTDIKTEVAAAPVPDNLNKQNQNSVANKTATPNTRANMATRGRASNRARRGTPRRY